MLSKELFVVGIFLQILCCSGKRPNIVVIVADDLGWGDVGWTNPSMEDVTPTLTNLARSGVILSQYYVQQVCSPSRAALMTGMYPYHIGRQKGTIKPLQPTGLTLNRTLLPEQLEKLGYSNHIVGKWHLGFCKVEYTPTWRGFHNFYGYYTGAEDYFEHERDKFFDFRRNMNIVFEAKGSYSTDLFTQEAVRVIKKHKKTVPLFLYLPFQAVHAPLEAPTQEYKNNSKTEIPPRDIYRAMLSRMDSGVSKIIQALKDKGQWDNTLLVFTTDNGGAVSMAGSNHPLRGTKGTLFEGGTHGVGFVAGGVMNRSGISSSELMHITDWYPTLLAAAGYTLPVEGLDGVNQWDVIKNGGNSSRTEMVYNMKMLPPQGAIRIGPYKLMYANKFNKDGWYNIDATKGDYRKGKYMKNKKSKLVNKKGNMRRSRNFKNRKYQHYIQEHFKHTIVKTTKKKVFLKDPKHTERIFNITSKDENNEFDDETIADWIADDNYDEESNVDLNDTPTQRLFERRWPKLKKHLFNVVEDPEERNDLFDSHPEVVEKLRLRVRELLASFVERDYPDPSPKGRPKHFKNVWSPGWC